MIWTWYRPYAWQFAMMHLYMISSSGFIDHHVDKLGQVSKIAKTSPRFCGLLHALTLLFCSSHTYRNGPELNQSSKRLEEVNISSLFARSRSEMSEQTGQDCRIWYRRWTSSTLSLLPFENAIHHPQCLAVFHYNTDA